MRCDAWSFRGPSIYANCWQLTGKQIRKLCHRRSTDNNEGWTERWASAHASNRICAAIDRRAGSLAKNSQRVVNRMTSWRWSRRRTSAGREKLAEPEAGTQLIGHPFAPAIIDFENEDKGKVKVTQVFFPAATFPPVPVPVPLLWILRHVINTRLSERTRHLLQVSRSAALKGRHGCQPAAASRSI